MSEAAEQDEVYSLLAPSDIPHPVSIGSKTAHEIRNAEIFFFISVSFLTDRPTRILILFVKKSRLLLEAAESRQGNVFYAVIVILSTITAYSSYASFLWRHSARYSCRAGHIRISPLHQPQWKLSEDLTLRPSDRALKIFSCQRACTGLFGRRGFAPRFPKCLVYVSGKTFVSLRHLQL